MLPDQRIPLAVLLMLTVADVVFRGTKKGPIVISRKWTCDRYQAAGVAAALLAYIVAACLLTGCHAASHPPDGPAGNWDTGAISANAGMSDAALETVEGSTKDGTQQLVKFARKGLAAILAGAKHIDDLKNWYVANYWKSNNELNDLKVKHAIELGQKDGEIRELRADDWYKAHQYWRRFWFWVPICYAGLFAIGAAFITWTGGTGVFAGIGVRMIRVLLLGHGKTVVSWLGA